MDIKIFGLFGCTAAYFTNLYMDNGVILYDFEGKDNKEENRRSGFNFDWGCMCINIKSGFEKNATQ